MASILPRSNFVAWRQNRRQRPLQLRRHHRAKDRDAEQAADLPQEHARRGCNPDQTRLHGALRDDVEQALRWAEPETQDEQTPHDIERGRVRRQLLHQEQADELYRSAGEQERFVFACTSAQTARNRGAGDQAHHHGQQRQTAVRRFDAERELQIERQENDRAHERHGDRERRQHRGRERPDLEDAERQNGLGRLAFDIEKQQTLSRAIVRRGRGLQPTSSHRWGRMSARASRRRSK